MLGIPDENVLETALGLLEWHLSIDADPEQTVVIADSDGKAKYPRLRIQQINESGVLSVPLLPSERE
jgi:hypothetical protein